MKTVENSGVPEVIVNGDLDNKMLEDFGIGIEYSKKRLKIIQEPDKSVLVREGAGTKDIPGKQRIIG